VATPSQIVAVKHSKASDKRGMVDSNVDNQRVDLVLYGLLTFD